MYSYWCCHSLSTRITLHCVFLFLSASEPLTYCMTKLVWSSVANLESYGSRLTVRRSLRQTTTKGSRSRGREVLRSLRCCSTCVRQCIQNHIVFQFAFTRICLLLCFLTRHMIYVPVIGKCSRYWVSNLCIVRCQGRKRNFYFWRWSVLESGFINMTTMLVMMT